ncbi:MAG: DinB family protein [Chloroflexota bacterium]
MEWRDLTIDGFGRALETLERVLAGVPQEELDRLPSPDTNPMGWLAWHIGRVVDHQISELRGVEQAYIKEGWFSRFGRSSDPQDMGTGHTAEQVAAFRSPESRVFVDYYRAVLEHTTAYLRGLPTEELARELNEPQYQPLPTVGVRIVSVLEDATLHCGQIAYVRGLIEGRGWQTY